MEAGRVSRFRGRNKPNASLHVNSPHQGGTNVPTKTEYTHSKTDFTNVDRHRNVAERDMLPHECTDESVLPRGHYSYASLRHSEPGMRHVGHSDKSLDGPASYQQDTTNIPALDQLDHLIPSKELLLHYKQKILQLNNDYQDLMEKVDQ
jgi:hypothetical protein